MDDIKQHGALAFRAFRVVLSKHNVHEAPWTSNKHHRCGLRATWVPELRLILDVLRWHTGSCRWNCSWSARWFFRTPVSYWWRQIQLQVEIPTTTSSVSSTHLLRNQSVLIPRFWWFKSTVETKTQNLDEQKYYIYFDYIVFKDNPWSNNIEEFTLRLATPAEEQKREIKAVIRKSTTASEMGLLV